MIKDIHIVTVNYLMADETLNVVTSLLKDIQNCPYRVAITVVDNSQNQDSLREILHEKFPRIPYIDPERNIGLGRASTLGFKSLPARYYFALNPDSKIPENSRTIERIIGYMDQNPKVGCIGPKILNTDGSIQESCYRFDLPSIFVKPLRQIHMDRYFPKIKYHIDQLLMRDFDHQTTQPVDWVLGAAMVIRKDVADALGWFDKRFYLYFEDCDWCRRMWNSGWPVYYVHDIVVEHKHGRRSARVPGLLGAIIRNKNARIHIYSWIKYLWKWRGTFRYF